LTDDQIDEIVEVLNSERFCDQAPAQVWATLLDEGRYLASVSTMYRILRSRHQVRERRRQARHPAHVKPELVADGPNQVWSWDITKLAGPHKWTWFHLYVILDVWSRYAVGWLVAPRESDRLAHELIAACATVENIEPEQLTLHADRGSSMTSRTVAQLLADLGVTRSHSRPHVSNDNPFSEAQFCHIGLSQSIECGRTSIDCSTKLWARTRGSLSLRHGGSERRSAGSSSGRSRWLVVRDTTGDASAVCSASAGSQRANGLPGRCRGSPRVLRWSTTSSVSATRSSGSATGCTRSGTNSAWQMATSWRGESPRVWP
jgi:hypothetical protein